MLKNKLNLQLREPNALFAVWQLSPAKIDLIHEHYGTDWQYLRPFLRLYDITGLSFDGGQAHELRQLSVKGLSSCWIQNLKLGRTYLADLGIWNREDRFLPLIRSNRITIPSVMGMDEDLISQEGFCSTSIFPNGRLLPPDYIDFSAYTVYSPIYRSKKQQNPSKED
ncbi:protein of unknown function [Paenibacillus sp. GP183]|nr:protein of unknown function [Paenibacillus sp. GP183]